MPILVGCARIKGHMERCQISLSCPVMKGRPVGWSNGELTNPPPTRSQPRWGVVRLRHEPASAAEEYAAGLTNDAHLPENFVRFRVCRPVQRRRILKPSAPSTYSAYLSRHHSLDRYADRV